MEYKRIKAHCSDDCSHREQGCRRTCIAYLVYQVGRNMMIEDYYKNCGGTVAAYEAAKWEKISRRIGYRKTLQRRYKRYVRKK